MLIDRKQGPQLLKAFDFRRLFIEHLGWDKYSRTDEKTVDGEAYEFQAVAEKRGVVFLICKSIPDPTTRLKLDKLIAKDYFQHLIVFADHPAGKQLWQWVRRESGKPLSVRTQPFHISQSGELLLQKLDNLVVSLEEEEEIAHAHIAGRVQAAFDIEKVTKKFYERFKAEHDKFLKFIEGIPDGNLTSWYASVTINRLMFLYFLQAKGFLDSDSDYLRNKLKESRDRKKDSYYRKFLCPLFFQGFACRTEDRPASINKLLGTIPYLNGGLFQRHQIEEAHGKKIDIPDLAFQGLFDFFKEYNWHLDERANRDDREINPDVLGYIFEKYINQKQMGAYYTKEDITEYISSNTILPFLLDAARKDCAVAFDKNGSVWRLLRDNPDRYIHDAVLHGTKLALPGEIAAGRTDVESRNGWNTPAPPEFGLPTEIWREVVERRRRCEEIKAKLTGGEIHEVNDLITYNLNIRQFAQDLIQYSEGPELLRAVFKALSKISVLDPTCGSGAFLFAALNILRPLYEACLHRMQLFVDESELTASKHPKKFEDFRLTLGESRQHPKQDYFILKRIIVDNLYGVDIMEEAVEICKLRLFLKLVAQLEPGDRIEPLPDVDFNIRAGNTLVGYARYEDVQRALGSKLDFENAMERIEDKAKVLEAAVSQFRLQQTQLNGTITAGDKQELRDRFTELENELNDFLAADYGIKKSAVQDWKQNHKPFHWFGDFHRIMSAGGFDVIIGNPPYIEKSKLDQPIPRGSWRTSKCPDIYAWVVERTLSLKAQDGRLGLIVPVSLAAAEAFGPLRDLIRTAKVHIWSSHFANRPAQLFSGAQNRLTIFLAASAEVKPEVFSTRYHRWDGRDGEREFLFPQMSYISVAHFLPLAQRVIPKIGTTLAASVFEKLASRQPLADVLVKESQNPVYWVRVPGYFCQFHVTPPVARPEHGGAARPRGELLRIFLPDPQTKRAAHALLNSSTFYVYFCMMTDGRHINPSDVKLFPCAIHRLDRDVQTKIDFASRALEKSFVRNTEVVRKSGLLIDSINVARAKPTIDTIDSILCRHYGFTDEELDYILNYEIKYRVGADAGDEE